MRKLKKVFSLLLSICMMVSLMPLTAFATGTEADMETVLEEQESWNGEAFWGEKKIWDGENQYSFENQGFFSEEFLDASKARTSETQRSGAQVTQLLVGGVNALQTTSGRGWSYNSSTSTLTLNKASINGGTNNPGILAVGDLTIVVKENTTNTVKGAVGIIVEGSVTITGGTLTVSTTNAMAGAGIAAYSDINVINCKSLSTTGEVCGVQTEGAFVVENSTVTAKSTMTVEEAMQAQTAYPPSGVCAAYVFITNSSNVTMSSEYMGCYCNGAEVLDSTLSANGLHQGIMSMSPVYVMNSTVTANSTLSFVEAVEMEAPYPPAGIWAENISVSESSNVTSTAEYAAFYCNGFEALDSTVNANALYFGIMSFSPINIQRSTVTAITNITLNQLDSGPQSGVVAIGGPCDTATIVESDINVGSTIAGIMIDANASSAPSLYLADSTVNMEAGYVGLFATSNIDIENCEIDLYIAMPLSDSAIYKTRAGMPFEKCGIYTDYSKQGAVNVTDSSVTIIEAMIGVNAYYVNMTQSTFDMTGGVNGIMGLFTTLKSCPSIQIKNDENAYYTFNEYVAQGVVSGLSASPAAIYGFGTMTFENCSNVSLSGAVWGIISVMMDIFIKDCNMDIAACTQTLGGQQALIVNSDLQLKSTWTKEQCDAQNQAYISANLYNSLELQRCIIENGGGVGVVEIDGVVTNSFVDANGNPLFDVTIKALSEESIISAGDCGNNVKWTLDKTGELTVYVEETTTFNRRAVRAGEEGYIMDDYASPEDAPWYPYKDQIKKIVIDELVNNIGDHAFFECKNLETVSIGESVEEIGINAFAGCDNIAVDFKGDEPTTVETSAFEGTTAEVTYPAGNETWQSESQNNYGENSIIAPKKSIQVTEDPCENGHEMGDWEVVREAACDDAGLMRKDCANCDAYSTATIGLKEHEMGSWIVVKEPTANEDGKEERTCNNCDYKESNVIDKLSGETIQIKNNNSGKTEKVVNLYTGEGKIAIFRLEREDYFGTENEQPVVEGYLFAGWFSDKNCTSVFTGTEGRAYAKFVDENVLKIMAQTTVGIRNSDEGKMRIISSVDSANYKNVGYIINIKGLNPINRKLNKVYKKFYAVNPDGSKTYYTPNMISKLSQYFVAFTLEGIPKSFHDVPFVITPYWTTQDGTYVEGQTYTKVVSQMPGY